MEKINDDKCFILVRYGELSTKGKNRKDFIKILKNNIKRSLEGLDCHVDAQYNRIYIQCAPKDVEIASVRLKTVFGIASYSVGYQVDKNLEAIKKLAMSIMSKHTDKTFKVETKRRDKSFMDSSDTINREIAGHILKNANLKVDVRHPDILLKVEIEEQNQAYVMGETILGALGYPVGAQGKILHLLSGGIDSPVAAHLLMRRGCQLEFIHFESMPYTSQNALNKVKDLARLLTKYQASFKMHIVPFTDIQLKIYEVADESYAITLMRRMMVRIAEKLALQNQCKGLASGESLGQVASQTIESINVISQAIDMVMLRPLIGFEKNEIIAKAKEIGTYETSILPFEDCCTIFTPTAPVTKPKLEKVLYFEAKADFDNLLDQAVNQTTVAVILPQQDIEKELF